jgi:hypothetical protein
MYASPLVAAENFGKLIQINDAAGPGATSLSSFPIAIDLRLDISTGFPEKI